MERLYQPDFSSVFGKKFCNAFSYGQIDTLIWPIFKNIERSKHLQTLLALKDQNDRKYFYYREISLEDHLVELSCSNISIGLIQAMDLGRSYGISNEDVKNVIITNPNLYKAIYSFDLRKDPISILNDLEKRTQIAGIVLYPSFIKENLVKNDNQYQKDLLAFCKEKNYFIKIDLGNLKLPDNDPSFTDYNKLKLLFSTEPEIPFILSGIDFTGRFSDYYELTKLYRNLWLEIDPRCLGGITPKTLFKLLFQTSGFIQNTWNRITIGSATPTLEISQMYRGFIEACEELRFAHKNLLKTWVLRNINRINSTLFTPYISPDKFFSVKEISKKKVISSQNDIHIVYDIQLRSFSITQLLHITEIIKMIFEGLMQEYPELKNGELLIRSYHTTTSLIINEHEFGNYLDLHYHFSELSCIDSSQYFHTVNALENRADFNHPDHLITTNYGSKQIVIPVNEKKLKIGNREDFYILVTFGPRTVTVFLDLKLYKEI